MQFGTATTELRYYFTTQARPLWGLLAGRVVHRALNKALVIMVSETTVDGAYGDATAKERGPGRRPKYRQPEKEEREEEEEEEEEARAWHSCEKQAKKRKKR